MSSEQKPNHLLFVFNQSDKAVEIACEVYAVYGEDTMPQNTAYHLFPSFRNRDFDLKDELHTG